MKVADIELRHRIRTMEGLEGYAALRGLVRLDGSPIGYVHLPVIAGAVSGPAIGTRIREHHSQALVRHLLSEWLAAWPRPAAVQSTVLARQPRAGPPGRLPSITVAVCTRNRPASLARCLQALERVEYDGLDILVVDNAPIDARSEHLVRESFPQVRYVREPRPGLAWARNRAIIETQCEIIAFTDDDAVVDEGWVSALNAVFLDDATVMAVTGLVVPYELETEAQTLFERYGGFSRGFVRRWAQAGDSDARWRSYHHTAQFGTGANMAFRRAVFEQVGYFDAALGAGTVTEGGEDLEMFFRVLREGHVLAYEPRALVRHAHRQTYAELRTQVTNNGIGFSAYLVRSASKYPDEGLAFAQLMLHSLRGYFLRRILVSFLRPVGFPRDLVLAELRGRIIGLTRYPRARREAATIARQFGQLPIFGYPSGASADHQYAPNRVAARSVDLRQPLAALVDLEAYERVRIAVLWGDRRLGSVDIPNDHRSISPGRLRDAIVDQLCPEVLAAATGREADAVVAELTSALIEPSALAAPDDRSSAAGLAAEVPVSILVLARNRPEALRRSLRCLIAQELSGSVEILVIAVGVDPEPARRVVAEFPSVAVLSQPGLAVARVLQSGVEQSNGEIIVSVAEGAEMPGDWLKSLISPLGHPDVTAVTGRVVKPPAGSGSERPTGQCETEVLTQPFEADRDWFESFHREAVPVWKLGTEANAAYRRAVFENQEAVLLDEALGADAASGAATYYRFYRLLKAGCTIVYEPRACVRLEASPGRSDPGWLHYRQGKNVAAYHLMTLLQDRDLRAALHLLVHLPRQRWRQIAARLRREDDTPWSIMLLEIAGGLAAPWALWRAHRRAGRCRSRLSR